MPGDSHLTDEDRYCSGLVRRYDRDHFLCALFAPDSKRRQLMALYAFNIEISGTRETVSEPMIGQMRLKWWFDALEGICSGSPPAHQVAVPLSNAISDIPNARNQLEQLIEARVTDLDDSPLPDLDALLEYAEHTSGVLAELALMILGVSAEQALKAARSAGIAYALTGMVRAVPMNVMRRRLFLPEDILIRTGLSIDDLMDSGLKNGAPANLIGALSIVIECAEKQLLDVNDLRQNVPKSGRPAILFNVLTKHYLKDLGKSGNNPFELPLRPPGPGVGGMMRLMWASLSGRI
jgi:NADH dehydrogenase [ubiquinone] 1 alpha subcomplex assembly factor 6